MGQASRICRAERFIAEFGKDLIATSVLGLGQNLVITQIGLVSSDLDETVRLGISLRDITGRVAGPIHLVEPVLLFDPECSDQDDLAEFLSRELDISIEAAVARLKKADLFR